MELEINISRVKGMVMGRVGSAGSRGNVAERAHV